MNGILVTDTINYPTTSTAVQTCNIITNINTSGGIPIGKFINIGSGINYISLNGFVNMPYTFQGFFTQSLA